MLKGYHTKQWYKKLFYTKLLFRLFGRSSLTEEDFSLLQSKFGFEVPKDCPATKAFLLGKAYATLSSAEYKALQGVPPQSEISEEDSDFFNQATILCLAELESVSNLFWNLSAQTDGLVNNEDDTLISIYRDLSKCIVNTYRSFGYLSYLHNDRPLYAIADGCKVDIELGSNKKTFSIEEAADNILFGSLIHFVPTGTIYNNGKLQIVDPELFYSTISKSVSGVSGGISSTVKPAGPAKTPGVPKVGSIAGLASPDNPAGPGRGHHSGELASTVEHDDWRSKGSVRPAGPGWEPSKTGGWAHIKGAGGAAHTPQDKEQQEQKKQESISYGKQPREHEEVLSKLKSADIVFMERLGDDDAGIHTTFCAVLDGGGRALLKPVEHETLEDHGTRFGTGYGSVPRNNSNGHETAAYHVSSMLGVNIIPPTTTRFHQGRKSSIQSWAEDHVVTSKMLIDVEGNKTKELLNRVPEDLRDQFKERLMDKIALDIVINNNDAHRDNLIVSKDITGFKSIDHSDSFGTGMKGIRNDFHHDFHKLDQKVKMSDSLYKNLKNRTFGDYKRAMKGHTQDWQVGQTYLRAQYALHLQDTEGHLDYQKFLPTMDSYTGDYEQPLESINISDDEGKKRVLAPIWRVNGSHTDYSKFDYFKKNKLLPNDLFESWAKKFIMDNKSDKESPFHEVANELDSLGVFMPSASIANPVDFRLGGDNIRYEASIKAENPPSTIDASHLGKQSSDTPAHGKGTIGNLPTIKERRKQDNAAKTVNERRKR